jgi:1-acyl-sn-glycerol-3-phosphate acyltransferase
LTSAGTETDRPDFVQARFWLAACWRTQRVCVHLIWGVAQILLLFPRQSKLQRDARIQAWARGMLRHLGIELRISGTPVQAGPALLVSNHISWVDVVALLAACHCRFVSKADVARWPLLGTLVTGAGTLYVKRESRRDAMRVVHRMVQALGDGDILAVFPEGTTSDGSTVLAFHSNLIQAAISAHAPVQAVALRIVDGRTGEASGAASYMGDESLWASIWHALRAPALCVKIRFGELQLAAGRDRRAWARDLQGDITTLRQF